VVAPLCQILLGYVDCKPEISKGAFCQVHCLVIVVLNVYLLIWFDCFVWSTNQLNPSHVFTEKWVHTDSIYKSGQEICFRRLWLGRQRRRVNNKKMTSQNFISRSAIRSENCSERNHQREILFPLHRYEWVNGNSFLLKFYGDKEWKFVDN
jgi:hypothetical protein